MTLSFTTSRRFNRRTGEESHIPACIWHRGNVLLGTFGLSHGAPGAVYHPIDLGLLISNDGIYFREPLHNFVLILGEMRHGNLGPL
jgi:hypothetical protein